jgi:hypothetical protein
MLTTFTIVVGTFLLFAMSRAYLRFREKSMSFRQFFFWILFWVGAGAVLFYPRNTDELANRLGISRGVDVIVYMSITVLFYLAFRIYAALSKMEREVTRLVRAIALEQTEREQSMHLTKK